PLQHARKVKSTVRPDDLKSRFADSSPSFQRRERFRIPIERNPAHHPSRAGIPWIVFPQRKNPAGLEATVDEMHRIAPLVGRNVMKDAITINQIDIAARLKILHQMKLRPR